MTSEFMGLLTPATYTFLPNIKTLGTTDTSTKNKTPQKLRHITIPTITRQNDNHDTHLAPTRLYIKTKKYKTYILYSNSMYKITPPGNWRNKPHRSQALASGWHRWRVAGEVVDVGNEASYAKWRFSTSPLGHHSPRPHCLCRGTPNLMSRANRFNRADGAWPRNGDTQVLGILTRHEDRLVSFRPVVL